mmetsp:Transcript_2714/g.10427  ORF Transcript_2714/g.10427 Transcript_2714/m.10427 type:complete len:92 (-) Transcript_2714:930-1205(-)
MFKPIQNATFDEVRRSMPRSLQETSLMDSCFLRILPILMGENPLCDDFETILESKISSCIPEKNKFVPDTSRATEKLSPEEIFAQVCPERP